MAEAAPKPPPDHLKPRPRDLFEEPKGDLPKHYAAIGRLVTSFSEIERWLAIVLRTLLGLPEGVARAVVGEMRAGDLTAMINRIINAEELAKESSKPTNPVPRDPVVLERIEALFQEIRQLKRIRDDVAHRRFFVNRNRMVFTNYDRARSPDAISNNFYTIAQLNELAKYAKHLAIRVHMIIHWPHRGRPSGIPAATWRALHEYLLRYEEEVVSGVKPGKLVDDASAQSRIAEVTLFPNVEQSSE